MKTSSLETRFLELWHRRHLMGDAPPWVAELPDPERNHYFHPVRKWHFDFAWPAYMLAVEMEGGIFTGGRHVRGAGYTGDCRKYNAALELGWRVFRFTATDVVSAKAGIQAIKQVANVLRLGRLEGRAEQLQLFR